MKLSLEKKCACIMPPGPTTTRALINALALAKLAEHTDPSIREAAATIIERECPVHPRGRMS